MQFITALIALASVAAAQNTLHFVNQDATTRTIYFTAQSGLEVIEPLTIAGLATANQTMPNAWIGNLYSVNEGAENRPGMLAEFRFNGWAGATYFDVSTIVNPSDTEGVKMVFPKNENTPVSGCQTFPCENAYNSWNDVATLSTPDSELVVLIGTLSAERRRGLVARMPRKFVEA